MKILMHLDKFEQKGSFEAWIRRITVNECISYIRANKNIQYTEQVEVSAECNDADDRLFESDIQSMIDALPEGCKMVFILYSIEGYKHNEIAAMLSVSEGTSKSQLAYARKLLQKNLIQHKMVENG